MSFFRVTLHRSGIGLPERVRDTLAALGLHRRGQIVYQAVNTRTAGMIFKVKELVRVQEVEERKTKAQEQAERQPEPGFWVEKAVPR